MTGIPVFDELMKYDPRNHFNKKDLCQRCLTCVDDDHDGDCIFCHRLTDSQAACMRRAVLLSTLAAVESKQ